MATNYKSTIGGAFSALGKTLMGCGVITQLAGTRSETLTVITIAGFVLDAVGGFFGHLFAADSKTVSDLSNTVAMQSAAIQTGDTSFLAKADAKATEKV